MDRQSAHAALNHPDCACQVASLARSPSSLTARVKVSSTTVSAEG